MGEQTTQILQQARNELVALNQKQKDGGSAGSTEGDKSKGKKKETAACKHIDQLLWKAEVDLENVEDMYLRHIDNQRDATSAFSISRTFSDIEESFSSTKELVKSWFR